MPLILAAAGSSKTGIWACTNGSVYATVLLVEYLAKRLSKSSENPCSISLLLSTLPPYKHLFIYFWLSTVCYLTVDHIGLVGFRAFIAFAYIWFVYCLRDLLTGLSTLQVFSMSSPICLASCTCYEHTLQSFYVYLSERSLSPWIVWLVLGVSTWGAWATVAYTCLVS